METPNTSTESTNMTAPESKDTKHMVKPPKTVKIEILRDVADPRSKDKVSPQMLAAGSIVDLPIDAAKELLNRKYPGMYGFSGERPTVEKTVPIRVARRYVAPEKSLDELEGA